ncbi:MAG: hypothetical protein AAF331_11230 [Pseudomonadota bacterium]
MRNPVSDIERPVQKDQNLFKLDDRSWTKNSVSASAAEVEVFFHLSDEFHPDPNDLDEAKVLPLSIPSNVMEGTSQLVSRDAVTGFSELVEHYREVLKAAMEHRQSYNDFSHHMWLRLVISSDEGAVMFAYYDNWNEMKALFEALKATEDGQQHWDVEQGWEMIILRMGSRFHFREGGFDQGGEYANVSFPRNSLLASFEELEARMTSLIERLTLELGEDYWSKFRHDLVDYD